MIEGRIRRWGNSYGILVSKDEMKRHNLNVDEEILMDIKKKNRMEELFGLCKIEKPTTQILRESRESEKDGILLRQLRNH
jgi:antitoxin component of MazEF toxin-antitoxin module